MAERVITGMWVQVESLHTAAQTEHSFPCFPSLYSSLTNTALGKEQLHTQVQFSGGDVESGNPAGISLSQGAQLNSPK